MALTDNLVSYYKLDETSGTTAYDSLGTNNGTNYGATINQTGKIGTAYSFDGVDDYILINDSSSIDLTNNLTLSYWLYIDAIPAGDRGFISKEVVSSSGYMNYLSTAGKIYFFGYGLTVPSAESTTTFSTGQWYYISTTYDGSNIKIYVNGNLDKTVASTGSITTNSLDLWVGRYHNTPTAYTNIKIDEFSMWNRALTSDEISQLYNSGDGLAYPFTTDVNFNATALTLSTTDENPTYIKKLTGGIKTKVVKTNYPITDGLLAKYTKQTGHIMQLIPEEKSLISKEKKKGL